MVLSRVFTTSCLLHCVLYACSVCANSVTSDCELGKGQEHHTVGRDPAGNIWPWQIYQSSKYNPPELDITSNGAPLSSGLIFISPSNFRSRNSVKEAAPIILTDKGQLVWNGPVSNATNLRATTYHGKPVLTFWRGLSTEGGNIGHGYGNVTFLNDKYEEILTVCPQLQITIPEGKQYDCNLDFHESYLTERNTLLVSAYNSTPADLSAINGPKNGWIFDCLVLEIDPSSQKILFRWSAIEHVPVTQTKQPLQGTGNESVPFDYFHINSIVDIGGSYLVNARHTWSTYLISSKGKVEWTLQGDTGGDFGTLPTNAHFRWQHHAIPHDVTSQSLKLTYFNNNNAAPDNGTNPTNGLTLHLPLPPKSGPVKTLQTLSDPHRPIYADSQGSHQILSNGNSFMGYGQIPIAREYGPPSEGGLDGTVRWTARFGDDNFVQSYRGFKSEWHATPKSSPSLVVKKGQQQGRCGKGYVSWNGATDVTAWEIWEGKGSGRGELQKVGTVDFKGFETAFNVGERCVQVRALEGRKAVAESSIVCED